MLTMHIKYIIVTTMPTREKEIPNLFLTVVNDPLYLHISISIIENKIRKENNIKHINII